MSTQDIQPATPRKPEILAPAGDTPSFLAALAAAAVFGVAAAESKKYDSRP